MPLKDNQLFQIIEKIGPKSEIDRFLTIFQSIPKIKFAVIYISKDIIQSSDRAIADNIALMNQLKIFPLLVLESYSVQLEKKIIKNGGHSDLISSDATPFNREVLEAVIQNNSTPIIAFDYLSSPNPYSSAEELAEALIEFIQPQKYIWLTASECIVDEQNKSWSFINIEGNMVLDQFSLFWQKQIAHFGRILKTVSDTAIVVTSPEKLLKEIFTVKGSGTFIKAHTILSATHIQDLNQEKLKMLLENAFGKSLKRGYFEQQFMGIFYQPDLEGAAFIQKLGQFFYLDKFAVDPLFQGTGLGKCLWNKINERYPSFIWRSQPYNPLNRFYLKECHGCQKYDQWHIFWKNLTIEAVIPVLGTVLNKTPSF